MKRILSGFQINLLLLLLLCSFQSVAQQQNSAGQGAHAKKIELKILSSIQQSDVAKMNTALTGYAGKIISHEYSAAENRLYVFISDAVDPVDVLQVLKMNGIKACYRDGDNGFVSLEADGKSTRKLYFKE